MLFNLWKMFNPLQNGGFNPLQQKDQQGFDPTNLFGKNAQGMPFDPKMFEQSELINDYVENIIKNSLPYQNENREAETHENEESNEPFHTSASIPYKVFEMHDYMIVRISLPSESSVDDISLSIVHHRLIVRGHPFQEEITITLPEVPSQKRVAAKYKDHIIEVRLKKRRNETPNPIPIRFD
ncbi:Hsp20/alpha crystallin family protein [Bacillus shivajii]|uniref:Hsp20/alpha crystallin family protein n=1 Tax=Bacillus shivajii TaxID=1983719 RepID=UPI001CFBB924|nr:Hsp20/alpha crystallin family protein [Bacillus shivajii]UCZ53972.1 Hsp20/alpha crystallin family protein [Bacillus shivajii]